MSKTLEAACAAGVVTVDGVPVPGATILSEGVGPSTGVVVIDEETKTYIAKTSPDLDATLDKVITALEKAVSALTHAATALTAIDGKPQGTLSPVPVAATEIGQVVSNAALVTAAKVELETLKGILR